MTPENKTALMTAVWLRREGRHAVVLVEIGGKWYKAIEEFIDSPFSHIAEVNGFSNWAEWDHDRPEDKP